MSLRCAAAKTNTALWLRKHRKDDSVHKQSAYYSPNGGIGTNSDCQRVHEDAGASFFVATVSPAFLPPENAK